MELEKLEKLLRNSVILIALLCGYTVMLVKSLTVLYGQTFHKLQNLTLKLLNVTIKSFFNILSPEFFHQCGGRKMTWKVVLLVSTLADGARTRPMCNATQYWHFKTVVFRVLLFVIMTCFCQAVHKRVLALLAEPLNLANRVKIDFTQSIKKAGK